MKKEMMVAALAIGFIFAGVISASAGTITWTMVETASMATHSPGADNRIGTGDDGTTNCNFSDATSCATTGSPTTGAYGFSTLNFTQTSSCALAQAPNLVGDPCTTNTDCGPSILNGVCTDCNTPSQEGTTYFAKNPTGGSKGLGTMTASACDNGFDYTNVAIGTTEVVGTNGGSCMTLTTGSTQNNSGCSGALSTVTSMDLWIAHPISKTACAFKAGLMPGLTLAGSVYDGATNPPASGICSYSAGQVGDIMDDAGVGAGQYMFITCGSGSLPTDLQSACLRGASWNAILVGKTSTAVPTSCGDACGSNGGGCMAGTAEDVE